MAAALHPHALTATTLAPTDNAFRTGLPSCSDLTLRLCLPPYPQLNAPIVLQSTLATGNQYEAFATAQTLIVAIGFCIAALAISMIDSFRFQPDSSGDEDFIARAQQKSAPGMKVSASALGARESERSLVKI
jgi:hypothetical protein